MFAGKLCRSRGIVARGLGFVSAVAGAAGSVCRKVRLAAAQVALGALAVLAASAAQAATYTWSGGPSGQWDTPSNWTPSFAWSTTGGVADFNTAGAAVTVNSVTATAVIFNQNASIANGTVSLVQGTNDLVNNASGTTTISSALNLIAPGVNTNCFWAGNSSGTLAINGPVTMETGNTNLFLYNGNYSLNSGGSLTMNGALVLNDSTSTTTNFLQTGGVINVSRAGPTTAVYLTQKGTTTYTVTGGSLVLSAASDTLAIGDKLTATMTVNGPGALVSTPILNLNVGNGGGGGSSGFYLQNGLLQADSILQSFGGFTFNFSGGTIQPVDNGTLNLNALAWGSATASNNVTFLMSGAGATLSSNDSSGVGRTVQVYAQLSGSGPLTTAGNGTLVFSGSANNANYSGALTIQSGIVQLNSSNALVNTSGTVTVAGGALDINGLAPATGAVVLASGSIIDTAGLGVLKGTSYTLQSGTASAALGGAGVPLTMSGPGLAVLAGPNTYTGGTTISGGTLQLNASNSLIAANGLLTMNGGTLDLNGNSAAAAGITGAGGLVTASLPGTLTLAPTAATAYSGNIGGAVGITLNAPGMVQTLAGSVSYTGATTVTAGTLSVTGGNSFSTSPFVSVSSGAVLDVSQLPGGLALTGGTLSGGRSSLPSVDINGNAALNNTQVIVAGGSAGTLTIGGGLSLNGATESFFPGDQITTTGALTLGGTDYVMPSVPLSAGTYTLLTGSGGLTGGTQNMAMAGIFGSSPRQSYVFAKSNNAMTLTVSGTAANLVWTGSTNSSWDNGISSNWYNTTSGSADKFYPADKVVFNDSAGTAGNVVINGGALGSVQPGSVLVSNTAVNFTFSGTGSLGGTTSLVKNGPGGLSINTSNSYSGGTFLNGGLITAGSSGALGSGALTISGGTLNSNAKETYGGGTILSGGLLNLGNSAALGSGPLTVSGGSLDNTSGAAMTLAGNLAQNWSGSFTFVGSKPLSLGNGAVTLGTTPTLTVGGMLTVGGNISGNYGLSMAGAGTLNVGSANSYTGNTTIGGGVLQLGSSAAIPTGAVAGNVVFTNAAAPAVLDLNGNNATINGLSQPSPSTTNMVINSLSGGTVTLTIGNNNVTSTFGGVLANNTGAGGVLALTKTGAGTLTLMGSETYTGATTISGGGLQLGTGIPGQDASIAASTSLVNNATLTVSNAGPTTLAVPITGAGNLVQNSPSTLTLSGQNTIAALALTNSGTITGGGISLTAGATFVNNAAGLSTLASPLNLVGGAANIWSSNSAGTLNIGAAITDGSNTLYLFDGNYTMGAAGSITVPNAALVMGGSNDTGAHTSNFLQTGGVVSDSRPGNAANTFFVSQGGTTNYTMTGGSLLVTTGTGSVAYNGGGKNGYLTINGAGAVASFAGLNLYGASGGTGEVNLLNGTLQVDNLFTNGAASSTAYDIFNFSGGTLQPLDSGVAGAGFGSATAAQNVTMTISGSGATMLSSDAGGVGRTVQVYANLTGSGALTAAGAGALVLQGSNTGFSGQISVNSGTVQIGGASIGALGSSAGSVVVNGGLLDINGNSSSNPGSVTLASGGIADSAGGGVLNAASYTLQSGTASAVLGGATAPLNKSTSGMALLTAANTYGGPTTISAGTLALGATGTLGNGSGNVTVSPGAALDVSAWAPAGYAFNGIALTAGRTGSAATDINGSISISNGTIGVVSPTASGTLTISGSLNMSGNDVYPYVPGDLIAVNGPLTFSNAPTLLLPSRSLAPGVITLMTCTGGSPDAAGYMAMGGIYQSNTRQSFTFGTSGGTAVTLSVVGTAGNLLWNTTSGTWDVSNTVSWFNTNTASADIFYQADNVTFNDRPGGAAASVNINAAVGPASMTVSNTAVSYTLNGSGGIIGSTSLVKNGPGSLTINTANGYSGGTFLNAGRLNIGNASALGTGVLTIGGGSLDASGGAMTLANNNAQNWNASFTFIGSYPLNLGTGTVALGTTPTVTVGAGTLTVGGEISGNYGLTVAGPGTLNLAATSNYTGNTTISSGVLQMGTQSAVPNGPGTGNVAFGSAANSAVLDLNGFDTTINGLSQPSLSTTNLVVDNAMGASNTLSVGNNNASSTFGGVLADNNNGSGGQLNLQIIGGGALTLINSNTFSGATATSGGTLQLGDGTTGHDGSINQTSDINNNATLAFDFFAPQTIAAAISGTGTIAQLGRGAVTLPVASSAGFLAIGNNGAISGGTLTLQLVSGNDTLANTATGATTLGTAIYLQGGTQHWTGGSGTLDIEGPITQSTGHLYIDNGNYLMGNSGSITVSGYALVLGDGGMTNFTQSGGTISTSRSNNVSFYLNQNGTTNYLMTGGSIGSDDAVIGYGLGTTSSFTMSGGAASMALLNLNNKGNGNANPGGLGTLNLRGGALAVDNLVTYWPSGSAFNFSGGTLQPIDGSVTQWGSNTGGNNVTVNLSGTGAVMSSTDAGGNPETVPVYANLTGTGAVTFTGSGTLVLGGSLGNYSSSNYSGGSFVTGSGTVQLARSNAVGSGPLTISSAVVDLDGFNSTVGALTGNSLALITNSGGTNSTLTISPSGTATTYAGTIADGPTGSPTYTTALTLTGTGTLYLSGTNTYTGGTIVSGDAELIISNNEALADNSSLIVGNASAFGGAVPAASRGQPAALPATPVPEPGTVALLFAAGAALLATRCARRRFASIEVLKRQPSTPWSWKE